jgi:hypothetical protein
VDPVELEHRHLRSALEFAVAIALEGSKRRPPWRYPAALKPYLRLQRLPAAALGPVRRAIEADDEFRARIAVGAVPELVDPIGVLWLQRPEGWREQAAKLVRDLQESDREADAAAALHRERKRRDAAEQVAARSRVEVLALESRVGSLTATVDELRAELAKLAEEQAETRAELIDARNEARHARDREAAAVRKLEQAHAQRDDAMDRLSRAEGVRDDVLADRADSVADAAELAGIAARARDLSDQLAMLVDVDHAHPHRAPQRRALALPGGVVGDSDRATEYLVRSGASVLVDGYNVAKLGWPDLDLSDQRRVLLDTVENVARRYGSDVTVVFDGADVVGAATDQRRLVRVVYSPEGVIADDVIRAEVARLPANRPVVVVTNDAQIVADVRVRGANTVTSDRFLALARR